MQADGAQTYVAVFPNMISAQDCADNLQARGFEVGLLSRRQDGPEQGLQPGNVIVGHGGGTDEEAPVQTDRLGSGVTVGATIGATAGLLAATQVVPGLIYSGALLPTIAGAGIGSFLGGLTEYLAAGSGEETATIYPGEVRKGGVLLLVHAPAGEAEEVRRLIQVWNPLEIREQ